MNNKKERLYNRLIDNAIEKIALINEVEIQMYHKENKIEKQFGGATRLFCIVGKGWRRLYINEDLEIYVFPTKSDSPFIPIPLDVNNII